MKRPKTGNESSRAITNNDYDDKRLSNMAKAGDYVPDTETEQV